MKRLFEKQTLGNQEEANDESRQAKHRLTEYKLPLNELSEREQRRENSDKLTYTIVWHVWRRKSR